MSFQTGPEPEIFRLKRVIDRAAPRVLGDIAARYGADSPNPKAYHNEGHTLDVYNAGRITGNLAVQRRLLTPRDFYRGLFTKLFHDYIQDHDPAKYPGQNEAESAEAAVAAMKHKVFTDEDREVVPILIGSTAYVRQPDGTIRQNVNPDDYRTLWIADCDLATKGMPTEEAVPRIKALYLEMHGRKLGCDGPSMNFIYGEEPFLNEPFYTDEANSAFPHRKANADYFRDSRSNYAVQ